jgi:hypothetical protein
MSSVDTIYTILYQKAILAKCGIGTINLDNLYIQELDFLAYFNQQLEKLERYKAKQIGKTR